MAKDDAAIGFTPAQVAVALGYHVDTIRKMVRDGEIAGLQFGGRRGRIVIFRQALIDRIERALAPGTEMAAELADEDNAEAENQRKSQAHMVTHRNEALALVAADREARNRHAGQVFAS
jgi:excisionase family DNA binding protein